MMSSIVEVVMGGASNEGIAATGVSSIDSLKLYFYKQFHSWRSSGCIVRPKTNTILDEQYLEVSQLRFQLLGTGH